MKKNYFLFIVFILFAINMSAQTITITGACGVGEGIDYVNGTYTASANINGKPSYTHGVFLISWSGTRWEVANTSLSSIAIINYTDTPTPPATTLSPWSPVPPNCLVPGIFSGDGTTTSILGISESQLKNTRIILYPNPSTNFVKISGLKKEENYSLYNTLGKVLLNGIISNNSKIDIKYLASGLYYLKLNNGNTIKFIKH